MVLLTLIVFLSNLVNQPDLVELDRVEFDVIIGMDWLHVCYALVDCRTQVVKFLFPKDPVIEWKSCSRVPKGLFISYLIT